MRKRVKKAFTILEILIAMSISGVVIMGMIQTVRNVQKMISKSRTILQINKSVCLLFNQIERDFNTALIPTLSKPEKKGPVKEGDDEKDEKKEEPKVEEEKPPEDKKKEEPAFFVGVADDNEQKRIGDKKYSFFIRASFVNTNPFQVWGQQKICLVRVGYELVKNKTLSTRTKTVFDLYRKETPDVKNEEFKEKEEDKTPQTKTHLVARNIKEMFIEYSMPKPKSEKKKTEIVAEEKEEWMQLFSWGKTKETKNIIPLQAEIRITFCGDREGEEKTYSCLIPIFSYPVVKEEAKKSPSVKKEITAEGAAEKGKAEEKSPEKNSRTERKLKT